MRGTGTPHIVTRSPDDGAVTMLTSLGVSPFLARLYAARGMSTADDMAEGFENLHPPARMRNIAEMAQCLADAIDRGRRLLIVADYDADGATACAVGMRALRQFGAHVDYLVPNRFEYGYGLTPEIVRLAHEQRRPDILITVDNGIASIDGVAEANRLGMEVLVTDHHLPGDALPAARCIVNPNQPGCAFPSKHIAGVGVMFYLMLALRGELRTRGAFATRPEPPLAGLLDLVALGTVADVVKLDRNNRILVREGLKRMRAGRMCPGIAALITASGRDPSRLSASDLGYMLGPRLNAAGRLTDMSLGIECLVTDDATRAMEIARQLDALNRERREIEAGMQESALAAIERSVDPGAACTISLFDPEWHPGVVGIVASRIKDRHHRPAIVFARGTNGEIRGSGRSITGLHLRDALDLVSKRHPGLLLKFGGHAAAAGLTIHETAFGQFREAFEEVTRELVSEADLHRTVETDGSLAPAEATLDNAAMIAAEVWGQGFPPPLFHDQFEVINQRIVGGRHLKLQLSRDERRFEAILFGQADRLPPRIAALYRLEVNEFRGLRTLQLTVSEWHPAT